jgi:AcrR family transcriptional regulator
LPPNPLMAESARAAQEPALDGDRLPPGRHGLPRELVAENQRERLLSGVVDAVAEHGYNAATIGAITEAAKVSRRTFYEHFRDKEDCYLAAYAMIDDHVRASMLAAGKPADPWPNQVRARLAAFLDVLSGDLAVARFYLTEPLAAGGEIAARYRDAMQLLAETVRPQNAPVGANVEVRDQVLMGGIASLIVRRLKRGEAKALPELLPDLTELTLAAHLGRDEARRIAREASI